MAQKEVPMQVGELLLKEIRMWAQVVHKQVQIRDGELVLREIPIRAGEHLLGIHGVVNRKTLERGSQVTVTEVSIPVILDKVEGNHHGTDQCPLGMEGLPGRLLEAKECANSMRADTAKRGPPATFCIPEQIQFTLGKRVLSLCTSIFWSQDLLFIF